MPSDPQTRHEVPVWDLFVRIFHWSLVLCVVLNYFVLEEGETAHEWSGYIAVGLICARIVWGFVGTYHARFVNFWPTPRRIAAHVRHLRDPDHIPDVGHNPLGALMMLALMALVLALGVSGWLMGTDAFWGEEWLEELHGLLANTLIVFASLHALAAIVMSHLEKSGLIRAMFTGKKRLPADSANH